MVDILFMVKWHCFWQPFDGLCTEDYILGPLLKYLHHYIISCIVYLASCLLAHVSIDCSNFLESDHLTYHNASKVIS